MPYISNSNNSSFRIETGEDTHQRDITVDGTTHSIDWRQLAPLAADAQGHIGNGGRYSLIIAGRSYDIFARRLMKPDEGDIQTFEIYFAGQRFEVQVEDEREKTLSSALLGSHDSGEAKVRAPMPGLVVGVPVAIGESISRGQTVVVLEAMKMENDLSSPMTGIVKEIKVNKGQTVNQGDILAVIASE